jgi:hypothetical protein
MFAPMMAETMTSGKTWNLPVSADAKTGRLALFHFYPRDDYN